MKFILPFMPLLLVLTACSEFQPRTIIEYPPVVTRISGTNDTLAELHNTREMTPEEIQQTVEAWQQDLNNDPSSSNHLKLALLMIAGDPSARDPKRARELLDSLKDTPVKSSDRELIALLRQILDEQDQANSTISKLKKQAGQQSRRIKELEEQQQALTDIEQNIQQREAQPDIENVDK